MFSLHERTQRRVCRVAFVLCCAVPTLMTMAWILHFHRPWHVRDLERSFTEKLHVQATVAHVSAPRPGQRKLTGVRLADLKTAAPLGMCDLLYRKPFLGKGLATTPCLTLPVTSLPYLSQLAATWLSVEEGPARTGCPMDLEIERIEFRTEVAGEAVLFTATNCRLWSEVTASGSQRLLFEGQAFDDAEESTSATVRLIAERRSDGTLRTFLDTQAATIPGWLLADLVPGAASWSTAGFHGKIEWEESLHHTTGNLQGTLSDVNLGEWMTNSPYVIDATGSIRWEELAWHGRRIESARGQITADGGTISGELLRELVKHLKFELVAEDRGKEDGLVAFDQFACRFRVNSSGLTVWGTCFDDSSGTVIAANGKPVVLQPQYSDLPLSLIVQVLAPLGEDRRWIPAHRWALNLAERLPLPRGSETAIQDAESRN